MNGRLRTQVWLATMALQVAGCGRFLGPNADGKGAGASGTGTAASCALVDSDAALLCIGNRPATAISAATSTGTESPTATGTGVATSISLDFSSNKQSVAATCTTKADCSLVDDQDDQCGCGTCGGDQSQPFWVAVNASALSTAKASCGATGTACPLICEAPGPLLVYVDCVASVCVKSRVAADQAQPPTVCPENLPPSLASPDLCGTNPTPDKTPYCVQPIPCVGAGMVGGGGVKADPPYWGSGADACTEAAHKLCS